MTQTPLSQETAARKIEKNARRIDKSDLFDGVAADAQIAHAVGLIILRARADIAP